MDDDYLSISAKRPWDTEEPTEPEQQSPAHYRGGGDTKAQIRCCLSCPMADCNNCMQDLRKGQLPEIKGVKEWRPTRKGRTHGRKK